MNGSGVVHVVDDDADILASFAIAFRVSGFKCRTYASGAAFLSSVSPSIGDCFLVDLLMPDMNGLDVLAELSRRGIRAPVIVLTAFGDIQLAVRAMRAGAFDFIEKPCPFSELEKSVNRCLTAAQDRLPYEEELASQKDLNELTRRERDVFDLVVAGHSNKEVGYDLGISARTVETHRARIMEKLKAKNLAELVRMRPMLPIKKAHFAD